MNKVYVVGLGPGGEEFMTAQARAAMERADVLCGYTVYVDLVKHLYPGKETYVTPMTRELERCRWALETAAAGRTVAMVCSGDAGVYGMAGLVFELAQGLDVEIEVIPGVTAALSGGAALGAPLTHDFAVISLSDLLTPWETIERRLECAARADLCVVLYNPASRRRANHLKKACEILMRHASAETVCGVARNIGREGAQTQLMTLRELSDFPADMFTTAFVGNQHTRMIDGKMVTPRGYKDV